jgi:hypothetical protein
MSLETITSIILALVAIYLVIGLVFAIAFVRKGAEKIDDGAKGISWLTRLLLIPASMAFWVFLLKKWKTKTIDN